MKRSEAEIRNRLLAGIKLIRIILLLFFLVGLGGSFWLQILKSAYFKELSKENLFQIIEIAAPRGEILDRSGKILAETRASFSVAIIKEFSRDIKTSLRRLSELLKIPLSTVEERFNRFSDYPPFKPLILVENLDIKEVSFFEAHRRDWPEFIVIPEAVRFYPFSQMTAHITGYVGEISSRELRLFPELNMGDIVGKKGLERYYDKLLRGEKGEQVVEVDSLGRNMGVVREKRPRKGYSLILTLDMDLQRKAWRLLSGKKGTIILMNPDNGEILALASSPSFDPNLFSRRFEREKILAVLRSPDKPLFTRAIQGGYPIGSTFKLVVAVAGLHFKVITPFTTFFCPGYFVFGGKTFRCWQAGGHGKVNLFSAIQHSCNVYFYNLGDKLGVDRIAEVAFRLNLGKPTGIDLAGEASGLVPTSKWKEEKVGVEWYPGETISLAIGQGYLKATPIQLAVMVSAIANRGWYPVPHLLKCAVKKGKRICYRIKRVDTRIEPEVFQVVAEGMKRVVNGEGTGRAARLKTVQVCGKTGTAQVVSAESPVKIKPHSLFVGFAPCENPQVVIAILIENAGAGGEVAAPLAREMLNFYFENFRRLK